MNEKKRLIKNTGLIAIGNFGAKIVSFLLLPLYTSTLTTSEYGTYDYIVAISTFLSPIATLSMTEAMFRFIIDTGNKGNEFKKVISNAFFIVLCGIAVLGAIAEGIDFFFPVTNLAYIWIYVTAGAFYSFSNNLLRGMGKIKEYAIISSGKNILMVMLNVLAIFRFRWGMQGLLFSMCVSELTAFIVVAIFSRLWNQIDFKQFSFFTIKEMLLYSLPLIPNTLCGTIINLSDRLIISNIMGTGANGIYSVSYKFPNIVETVYHYFYTAWSESASRILTKGWEEATKYYQSLYEQIDNLVFSVILLMTAGMPIIFRVFVKGDYIQGFCYVPLLMFAMYFDCMAKYYSGLFTALKKTKFLATSTIIAAIINIVLNLFLVKKIGLYAAAGSTLVADIFLVLIRKYIISKEMNIKVNYYKVSIEIILIVIIALLYDYNSWTKIGGAVVVAGIYAVYMNKNIFLVLFKVIKRKFIKCQQ